MAEDIELVAYCGLYCGECPWYKGEIADMAKDLRKKLVSSKFDKVAEGMSLYFKNFNDYPQCCKVLETMGRLRCKRSCRNGGANPRCKARLCCQKKNIEGCWDCTEFESCSKLDFLKPINGKANLKNMQKIKKSGMKAFLKGRKYWLPV
jgi:hypothetical protein